MLVLCELRSNILLSVNSTRPPPFRTELAAYFDHNLFAATLVLL